jgi:hypothetical protein
MAGAADSYNSGALSTRPIASDSKTTAGIRGCRARCRRRRRFGQRRLSGTDVRGTATSLPPSPLPSIHPSPLPSVRRQEGSHANWVRVGAAVTAPRVAPGLPRRLELVRSSGSFKPGKTRISASRRAGVRTSAEQGTQRERAGHRPGVDLTRANETPRVESPIRLVFDSGGRTPAAEAEGLDCRHIAAQRVVVDGVPVDPVAAADVRLEDETPPPVAAADAPRAQCSRHLEGKCSNT